MRPKTTVFFVGLFFALLTANAQTPFDDYQPMRSVGELPTDFKTFFKDKAVAALEASNKDDFSNKKEAVEFHFNNQYFIDNLITSGDVMYGDVVTNYVQKVLDNVLAIYGETNKNFRVYTVRSAVFNAAATQDGILLVNLGLMAQVENEAQLAFVLAHEIIHSEENHIREGFKNERKLETNYSKKKDKLGQLVSISTYSKSVEFEADLVAFKRVFGKSGYDYREALRVMDVMLYSYLPFDEIPFPVDFFNSGALVIDSSFIPQSVNSIKAIEDFDDSLATHPNLRLRKEALTREINKLNKKPSQQLFLLEEDAFDLAQVTARFELCRIFLNNRQYVDAVYNAFLLLQDYPNNEYLQQIIGASLNAMMVYKNMEYTSFLQPVTDVEGEKMALATLFDVIPPLELSILATRYNYELYNAFPNNKEAHELFQHSLKELIYFHELDASFFARELVEVTEMTEEEDPAERTSEDFVKGRSKKVTALKTLASQKTTNSKTAFVDLFLNDTAFTTAFDAQLKEFATHQSKKSYVSLKTRRTPKKRARFTPKKELERNFKKAEEYAQRNQPPIEKVVVIAPQVSFFSDTWFSIDPETYEQRVSYTNNYKKTADEQIIAREVLSKALSLSGLEHHYLDPKSNMTNQEFNDFVELEAWVYEFFRHPLVDNRVMENAFLDDFVERYGTPYVLVNIQNVFQLQNMIGGRSFGILASSILLPTLSPIISKTYLRRGLSENHIVVINVQDGTIRTIRSFKQVGMTKIARTNVMYAQLLDIKQSVESNTYQKENNENTSGDEN